MAKRSLPDVSAKLIADVEKFVSDFKRADNEARRSMANIDKQVDELSRSIKKKFSAADIGKSMMQGLGIGSGFQVAQMAADKLVEYFRQQAEYAKDAEESTGRILALTKQIIALQQTPEQQLAVLDAEWERLRRASEEARKPKPVEFSAFVKMRMTPDQLRDAQKQTRPFTEEELQEQRRSEEELKRVELERARLRKSVEAAKAAEQNTALTDATREMEREREENIRRLSAALKVYEDGYKDLLDTQTRANDLTAKERAEVEALAEKYRRVADPLRVYRAELEEIERARARLTAEEYAAATGDVQSRMVDAGLKDFFGEMDKQSGLLGGVEKLNDAAKDMGWSFASAFEDAILSASKLSDVVDGLIQDIARIALRSMITAPLGSWIGGMFSGMFKAEGGPVIGNQPYIVGERGPELFVPKTGGDIVPNNRLAGVARGGGGDAFTFNYSIGSGVTQAQLMPILAMQKREIIGAIADAKRRRQPMSASI